MAYSDSVGDNAYLLKRTVRGVADFTGRSRRTEVIYYWIATMLFGMVTGFALFAVLPFNSMIWLDTLLQLIFVTPMFALFVRRLHDQDRSGWWGLLLPVAVVLSVFEHLSRFPADADAMIAQKTSPTAIALDILSLAIIVLFIWPGTAGPNKFGPDPRLETA